MYNISYVYMSLNYHMVSFHEWGDLLAINILRTWKYKILHCSMQTSSKFQRPDCGLKSHQGNACFTRHNQMLDDLLVKICQNWFDGPTPAPLMKIKIDGIDGCSSMYIHVHPLKMINGISRYGIDPWPFREQTICLLHVWLARQFGSSS